MEAPCSRWIVHIFFDISTLSEQLIELLQCIICRGNDSHFGARLCLIPALEFSNSYTCTISLFCSVSLSVYKLSVCFIARILIWPFTFLYWCNDGSKVQSCQGAGGTCPLDIIYMQHVNICMQLLLINWKFGNYVKQLVGLQLQFQDYKKSYWLYN